MQRAVDTEPHPAPKLRLGPAELVLLVLHSTLWGSAFFFVDLVKYEVPAFTIASLRLVPAVAILVVIVTLAGLSLRPMITHWRSFLALAVVNNWLPFVLVVYGQGQLDGGVAAVFNATSPLFGLLLAHTFTSDEKLTSRRLIGVVIGIAGVAVLTGGSIFDGDRAALWAKLALLGAALCYAIAGIYSRSISPQQEPLVMACGQMTYALCLSIPLMLVFDRPWEIAPPSPAAFAAIAGMGIFGSALATICFFTLVRRSGATNALLVTLLLPLTPIVLGAVFLGHRLGEREAMGAAIVAVALLVIDGRLLRRPTHSRHGS